MLARLPLGGCQFSRHVVDLVTDAVLEAIVDGAGQEVHSVDGSVPGLKSLVHEYGRGCVLWSILVFPFLITGGGVVIRMMGDIVLLRSGLGLGNSLGFVQAHVSRFARFQLARSCMQA